MDRSLPENELKFEVDQLIDKKQLGKLVDLCFAKLGPTKTSHVLDAIKSRLPLFDDRRDYGQRI